MYDIVVVVLTCCRHPNEACGHMTCSRYSGVGRSKQPTKKGREKTHNLKEIEPPNKPKRYPAQINVFCTLPSIHNGTYTRYSLYSSTDQTNTIKSDQLLVVPNKQKWTAMYIYRYMRVHNIYMYDTHHIGPPRMLTLAMNSWSHLTNQKMNRYVYVLTIFVDGGDYVAMNSGPHLINQKMNRYL